MLVVLLFHFSIFCVSKFLIIGLQCRQERGVCVKVKIGIKQRTNRNLTSYHAGIFLGFALYIQINQMISSTLTVNSILEHHPWVVFICTYTYKNHYVICLYR